MLLDRVNEIISTYNVKKKDFAIIAGVSGRTIRKIRTGDQNSLDPVSLLRICLYFGIDYKWLKNGEDCSSIVVAEKKDIINSFLALEAGTSLDD